MQKGIPAMGKDIIEHKGSMPKEPENKREESTSGPYHWVSNPYDEEGCVADKDCPKQIPTAPREANHYHRGGKG